jgi:hypothetical protein
MKFKPVKINEKNMSNVIGGFKIAPGPCAGPNPRKKNTPAKNKLLWVLL